MKEGDGCTAGMSTGSRVFFNSSWGHKLQLASREPGVNKAPGMFAE